MSCNPTPTDTAAASRPQWPASCTAPSEHTGTAPLSARSLVCSRSVVPSPPEVRRSCHSFACALAGSPACRPRHLHGPADRLSSVLPLPRSHSQPRTSRALLCTHVTHAPWLSLLAAQPAQRGANLQRTENPTTRFRPASRLTARGHVSPVGRSPAWADRQWLPGRVCRVYASLRLCRVSLDRSQVGSVWILRHVAACRSTTMGARCSSVQVLPQCLCALVMSARARSRTLSWASD